MGDVGRERFGGLHHIGPGDLWCFRKLLQGEDKAGCKDSSCETTPNKGGCQLPGGGGARCDNSSGLQKKRSEAWEGRFFGKDGVERPDE